MHTQVMFNLLRWPLRFESQLKLIGISTDSPEECAKPISWCGTHKNADFFLIRQEVSVSIMPFGRHAVLSINLSKNVFAS